MKKFSIFLCIVFLIFMAGFFWWENGISPANSSDKSQKIFLVGKGEGVRQIANNLKKEGLIKDPVVFFLLIKQLGLDGKIQAGDFRLSPSQNAQTIAKNLTVGILDIWVTVPEGKRAEEVADILSEHIPSYEPEWKEVLMQNEGYLFPDTYLIPKDASINAIVEIMRNNFESKWSTIENTTSLTKAQIVTKASLIEREAKTSEDQLLISSVIDNRLKAGMPLQIDATIQYALGYQAQNKSWWKKGITLDDLKFASSFNTYTNPGFPPGPICNPGSGALFSAANPSSTDYLFYITDKSGTNHYAKTFAEHNTNIQKYGL